MPCLRLPRQPGTNAAPVEFCFSARPTRDQCCTKPSSAVGDGGPLCSYPLETGLLTPQHHLGVFESASAPFLGTPNMQDIQARRLEVLAGQLQGGAQPAAAPCLQQEHTSAAPTTDGGHQYSVVLPETLTSNNWEVRR